MNGKQKDSFWIWGVVLGVFLVAVGVAVYFYQRESAAPPPAPVAAAPPPVVTEPTAVAPAPTPPPARTLPLPALDDSDTDVQGGLTELLGPEAIARFLVPERIVRNIVVTIDNAPREQMALQQRPVKPTPGEFIASGPEDMLIISPQNYARYAPLIAAVRRIDAKTLVALYRGMQPLFQEAYEDLGHPNEQFNARLIEVIDHLLKAPDVPSPVRLVRPSVRYRFADPALESLSSGQRLLIRMGPDNAAVIKAKLREIRAELG
jgi:Protein of unknown function (DUF3014)